MTTDQHFFLVSLFLYHSHLHHQALSSIDALISMNSKSIYKLTRQRHNLVISISTSAFYSLVSNYIFSFLSPNNWNYFKWSFEASSDVKFESNTWLLQLSSNSPFWSSSFIQSLFNKQNDNKKHNSTSYLHFWPFIHHEFKDKLLNGSWTSHHRSFGKAVPSLNIKATILDQDLWFNLNNLIVCFFSSPFFK